MTPAPPSSNRIASGSQMYQESGMRTFGEPLSQLFDSNLGVYALVSLALIVAQGVLLDAITSFLLDRLQLGRLE